MSDLLTLAEKKTRRVPGKYRVFSFKNLILLLHIIFLDVRSCTNLEILRRFLTIHEQRGKRDIFFSASTLVSEIEVDVVKLNLFPKQTYYIRSRIIKLYERFCNVKKNFKKISLVQMKHVLEFQNKLSDPFLCTQAYERAAKKPKVKASFDNKEEEMQVDTDNEREDPDWLLVEAKKKISEFVFISPKISRLLDSLGISSYSMSLLFVEQKRINNVDGGTSCSFLLKRRSSERNKAMKRLQEFEFPDSLILHWDGKRMQNNSRDMVERLIISVSATNGMEKLISCNFIPDGTAKSISNELKKQCDELKITKKIVGLSYDTTAANSGLKGGAAVLFEKSIGLKATTHLNRRPCRLHQKELCVANPFKEVVMKTVGAGIPIFVKFRKWFIHNRDLQITPAYNSITAKLILDKHRQSLIDFYAKQVQINHRRTDHREVAELALVHLNANPGYKLKACGADHHARWLSKVIYVFKIMLLKDHFCISEILMEQFESMLLYFITVYLKFWFTCESTIFAPKNDLDFLSELEEFSKIKGKYFSSIANNAKATQLRHLEYLSEDNAVFSIFDERISLQEKEELRIKLLGSISQHQIEKLKSINPNLNFHGNYFIEEGTDTQSFPDEDTEVLINIMRSTDQMLYEKDFINEEENEEISNNIEDVANQSGNYDNFFSKSPLDFITLQSFKSLVNFGINISFMSRNANEWPTDKSFVNAIKIARNIKSTSIYTEQLVGRISRLNDSGLLKNKEHLHHLAVSAMDKTED